MPVDMVSEVLSVPPDLAQRFKENPGAVIRYDTIGPQDQPLRALARQNFLPGRKAPVVFLAQVRHTRGPGDTAHQARDFGG